MPLTGAAQLPELVVTPPSANLGAVSRCSEKRQEFTLENYDAVLSGRADLTLVDSDSAYSFLDKTMGLKIAFAIPDSDESYGFALPKGSDLLGPLDAYLEQLEASGELARIKARYLSPPPPGAP